MSPQTLQTVSQIAIVVGVILTGLGGFGAFHYGRRIDQQKEQEASAREDALKADIGKLLTGNASLERRLEPFESLAKQLHPNVASDEALALLQRELDAVSKKAADLETKLAPRRLTPDAIATLAEGLRSPSAGSIEISAVMGDTEAFTLAGDLKVAFEKAGWKVNGVNQSMFSVPVNGLVVSVGRQPPPEAANHIFRAFQRIGITISGNLDPAKKGDDVALWVGSK